MEWTSKRSGRIPRRSPPVERKLQRISEAAIGVSDSADRLCPGLPWRNIRGLGNWLRHQYDRIDLETLWRTVELDLPPLRLAVESAIAKLRE